MFAGVLTTPLLLIFLIWFEELNTLVFWSHVTEDRSQWTEESFQINLNFLFNSDLWNDEQHGKFKNWMNNVWLPCYNVCKISKSLRISKQLSMSACVQT